MSTRLAPLVTPFSECAKFKNGEERRERGAKERFSHLLNFAHSLNGVTRGESLVLNNQLCFPSIILDNKAQHVRDPILLHLNGPETLVKFAAR